VKEVAKFLGTDAGIVMLTGVLAMIPIAVVGLCTRVVQKVSRRPGG
jgi:hypothetical protein